MFLQAVVKGIMATLTVNNSPLYRYPYRNSAEAFRGDWKKVSQDITSALDSLHGERQ